jgi:hypothetical protein
MISTTFPKSGRLSVLVFLLMAGLLLAQSPGNPGSDSYPAASPARVLKYDATYAGYKFAEIDLSESDPYEFQGDTVINLECSVRSSSILTIDGRYRSVVRDDYTVLYFKSDEGSPENRKISEYWFDYDNRRIDLIWRGIKDSDTTRSRAEFSGVDRRYFDSISLIFRIRDGFDTLAVPVYLPVFTRSRVDSILIEEISPSEETGPGGIAIAVTKIEGKIPFEIYPGFGDDFEITLTSDEARTPVRARMEMALGHIDIRLTESR